MKSFLCYFVLLLLTISLVLSATTTKDEIPNIHPLDFIKKNIIPNHSHTLSNEAKLPGDEEEKTTLSFTESEPESFILATSDDKKVKKDDPINVKIPTPTMAFDKNEIESPIKVLNEENDDQLQGFTTLSSAIPDPISDPNSPSQVLKHLLSIEKKADETPHKLEDTLTFVDPNKKMKIVNEPLSVSEPIKDLAKTLPNALVLGKEKKMDEKQAFKVATDVIKNLHKMERNIGKEVLSFPPTGTLAVVEGADKKQNPGMVSIPVPPETNNDKDEKEEEKKDEKKDKKVEKVEKKKVEKKKVEKRSVLDIDTLQKEDEVLSEKIENLMNVLGADEEVMY